MAQVLIVDDERDVGAFLSSELRSRGHEVDQASNGVEALMLVLERRLDAVVMDIRMPTLDGIDTLRILRRLVPAMPVILMTGYAGRGDMLLASQLGAVSCLLKPIGIDRLLQTLDHVLAHVPAPADSLSMDRTRSGHRARPL